MKIRHKSRTFPRSQYLVERIDFNPFIPAARPQGIGGKMRDKPGVFWTRKARDKILSIALGALFVVIFSQAAGAAKLTFVSDTIANSAPDVFTNHTIKFTTINTIPASGQIVITPQSGSFTLQSGLDYTDIDLLLNSLNLILSSSPGSGAGSAIGVSVTTGTSGSITFTLNNTDAIAASSSVIIRIGTNASLGETGDKQIKNPLTAGSYKINIKTKNSFGAVIDEAEAVIAVILPVSVTAKKPAVAPPPPPPPPPPTPTPPPLPSGGGGAPPAPAGAEVFFRGFAYPSAEISIFRNGSLARQDLASLDGRFDIKASSVSGGPAKFDLSAKDTDGRSSITLTIEATIYEGSANIIDNIIFPPTIEIAENSVRQGERFITRGQAFPISEVLVVIDNKEPIFSAVSLSVGIWGISLDTSKLRIGEHTIKAQEIVPTGQKSTFSKVLPFKIFPRGVVFCKGPDINADGLVNLQDFSILLFWWKAKPPGNPCADINGDGAVNLVDFSILLFNWMRKF